MNTKHIRTLPVTGVLRRLSGLCGCVVLFSTAGAPAATQLATAPAAASPAEDGNWTLPAKDFANTRYSGLSDITAANAKDLQIAFTFSTETLKGQESAVLAIDGALYFVGPYPNVLYAIDITQPGGALKWKFEPKPDAAAQAGVPSEMRLD